MNKKFKSYVILPVLLQTIAWPIIRLLFTVFARFKVEGLEHLNNMTGPGIFVSNHPNQADPIFVRCALPWLSSHAPLFWLSRDKKTYNWSGWRKYIFTDAFFLSWGAPVAPAGLKNYAESLKTHVRLMYDGYDFNMFPQAGDEKFHGKDAPIHGGVAYLAHATGAPIVPIAIIGSEKFHFLDLFAGKCQITVIFGVPIPADSLGLFTDEDVTIDEYKTVARSIMDRIYMIKSAHEGHGEVTVPSIETPAVVHDTALRLEKDGSHRNPYNFFVVPLLNALPPRLRNTAKKTNRAAREVIEHKTTHRALEVLYQEPDAPRPKTSAIEELFYKIWFSTSNSKAVRNRLKIVKRELKHACTELFSRGEDVRLISIASGSARAVIEALNELTVPAGKSVKVLFVDKSPHALEYSKRLAGETGLTQRYPLSWAEDTASKFMQHHQDGSPNIVEMVGLLDYFDDTKMHDLFENIHTNLAPGGYFITGNIAHNRERKFVTKFIGWKMVYRFAQEVARAMENVGFDPHNIRPYYEPMRVQSVVVAQKQL